ncbi:MAG: hypothetical protein HFH53_11075 [Hespellia sp.]|jgi:mannose/fructose/N-acetylgalactosamine-specific phosphotransferase system component IID/mannose/fructose/N-acetylgalactosamine-specific phosphotransferase system component IIC|nr:hypothetical protein [Hespellia sp.]
MSFTFFEALIVGILYYIAYMEFSIPFIGAGWQDPATIGFLIGLFYGDYKLGLIVGASIGMMYISNVAVGGNLPSDGVLAACVAVPIAIKFNLDATTAVAFSIPFAVLGTFVDNGRRLVNGMWNRRAMAHVEKEQYNKMWIDAILGPSVISMLFRIVPLTALLWLFGGAAGDVVSQLPAWLNNGLSVIGGMLPGLGLILCIQFMGKKELLPYFLVGFYAISLGHVSIVFVALAGICLAFLHVQFTADRFEEDDYYEEEEPEDVTSQSIYGADSAFKSRGSLVWWGFKFCCFFRISQCLEYFYGTGIGYMMLQPLKRVYKENREGYQTAIKRHLEPFITNPSWGAALVTGSIAMEEDIAKTGDANGEKGEAIRAFKTGLMGPLAGIGDSFEGLIVMPLCKSICYPLALAGNVLGAFPYVLWFGWMTIVALVMDVIGYEQGRKGISKFINSPIVNKVLYGAGVLGIMMMGALSASYVALNITISWETNMGVTDIASIVNGLIPNFFTLLYLGICYILLNKGKSFTKILIGVVIFGLLGSLIGIV